MSTNRLPSPIYIPQTLQPAPTQRHSKQQEFRGDPDHCARDPAQSGIISTDLRRSHCSGARCACDTEHTLYYIATSFVAASKVQLTKASPLPDLSTP